MEDEGGAADGRVEGAVAEEVGLEELEGARERRGEAAAGWGAEAGGKEGRIGRG